MYSPDDQTAIEQWADLLLSARKNKFSNQDLMRKYFLEIFEDRGVDSEQLDMISNQVQQYLLSSIMRKRINALHTYTLTDPAIIFITEYCQSPGDVVIYCNFLQYYAFKSDNANLTLRFLTSRKGPFSEGFFTSSVLQSAWDKQKIERTEFYSSDNLLDYPLAGKSIEIK